MANVSINKKLPVCPLSLDFGYAFSSVGDVGLIPGSGRSPGMATHSSILAWEIPWAEEPSRLHVNIRHSSSYVYSWGIPHGSFLPLLFSYIERLLIFVCQLYIQLHFFALWFLKETLLESEVDNYITVLSHLLPLHLPGSCLTQTGAKGACSWLSPSSTSPLAWPASDWRCK